MKKDRKSVGYFKTLPKENVSFGMNLLRPFYEQSKENLRNYCLENSVLFGDDETNFEPIYARNKLRIEKLSKLSEQEKETLFKQIVLENNEWNKNLNNLLKPFKNKESLTFSKLTSEDIDSQVLILYDYIASNLKDASLNEKLSKNRLLDMLEKFNRNPNVSIKLKDDIHLVKEYEKLWIKSEDFENYSYVLEMFEELKTPYFEISLNGKNMEGIAVLKEDYPLTIRPYKNDDYIEIKDGHKSVRRLYIDKKIPASLRKTLPILLNKDGKILLIPSLYKEVKRKSLQSNFFMIKYHKY
jgi:tRNA(Ile)-lysidine synthetase-like protein